MQQNSALVEQAAAAGEVMNDLMGFFNVSESDDNLSAPNIKPVVTRKPTAKVAMIKPAAKRVARGGGAAAASDEWEEF